MRILVVEDYKPLRESIVQALREADYTVESAAEGRTGLWHAQDDSFDVIVLDIMLPGLDGLAVLKQLRKASVRACVLILTARDTTEDRVRGLDCGADDYLTKPFALAELLARVRALLRRRYQQLDLAITIGALTVDTCGKTARSGDSVLDLSAREYALLEYLALRRGEVVTRDDIWKHLYDPNAVMESNVVDVFIGLLRKKLDRHGLTGFIQTRRGQGYMLEKPD
ncbi:MAG: response regulator transcription factor [Phycisphaerales bacterium]|nr:response regulator transcription factor [Phycisphaerales bacterium]